MMRRLGWFVTIVAVLAAARPLGAQVLDARGLGWGGWPGPGIDNAAGRAIDSQTAINMNEYLFQSQLAANRRYRARNEAKKQRINETIDAKYTRLRDNPTTGDISKGDALNVAYDELTNPKVYARALEAGKSIVFPGTKIKAISFQYASLAITTSIEDLTKASATPELLNQPEFAADLAAYRKLQAGFQSRAEEDAESSYAKGIPADQVKSAKAYVKRMSATLERNASRYKKGSAEYKKAENYLKGLYIVTTMLESPSMTSLLSGVENQQGTTIRDLLRFMYTSNLRFAAGVSEDQRELYLELYGLLDGVRKQVLRPEETIVAQMEKQAKSPPPASQVQDLFQGMEKFDFSKLDRLRILPPLPDEIKKRLPPPPGRRGNLPPPPGRGNFPPPPFGEGPG